MGDTPEAEWPAWNFPWCTMLTTNPSASGDSYCVIVSGTGTKHKLKIFRNTIFRISRKIKCRLIASPCDFSLPVFLLLFYYSPLKKHRVVTIDSNEIRVYGFYYLDFCNFNAAKSIYVSFMRFVSLFEYLPCCNNILFYALFSFLKFFIV